MEEEVRIEVGGEGPYPKITIEFLGCEDCHRAISALEQELGKGSKGKSPRLTVYPNPSVGKPTYRIKLLK